MNKKTKEGLPAFGSDFAANAAMLEDYYGHRNASDLSVGVLLTNSAGKKMFVHSSKGQYISAAVLYWFANEVDMVISDSNRHILSSFMAHHWNDNPGTGRHSVLDFIRDDPSIVVRPIEQVAGQFIDELWEDRASLSLDMKDTTPRQIVEWTIAQLDSGILRVAEKRNVEVACDLPGAWPQTESRWGTNQWIKKAVLISFRLGDNMPMGNGPMRYFDKVPLKFEHWKGEDFRGAGIRAVPGAVVRHGAYIGKNVVLMPSFVNIGAYVGEGTMIDTWATVGSCAQIGKNCHLSGGVGIGGVLEPIQANPTIIGDNCFIGARSEIVEGVEVMDGCVISMGVYIGQSTPIYDRNTGAIFYGRVPPGSVVVAGSLPSKIGHCHLNCAVIVKMVDAQTRAKTSPNELLRGV